MKDARGSGRGQLEKNIITVLSSENVLKLEKISGTKDGLRVKNCIKSILNMNQKIWLLNREVRLLYSSEALLKG